MNNYVLLIPIAIVIICIIAIIIYLISKSKNDKEEATSILDVNEVGVPSSSDFSYGYEKEETVIMNPVNETSQEDTTSDEKISMETKEEDIDINKNNESEE